MTSIRQALEQVAEEASKRILAQSGDKLLANTEALATQRVGRISGVYHSSFRLVQSRFKVEVVNDAPHAAIVEKGSAPHPIEPRTARMLRMEPPLQSSKWGIITHLPRVNHPGTEGHWVLRDALRATVRELFRR